MSADTKAKNQGRNALLLDLTSDQPKKVLSALEKIADDGSSQFVRPLLEVFRDSQNQDIRTRVQGLLSSLKISEAEDILLEALEDDAFSGERAAILSFIWNSGFQPADSVDLVVKTALKGDYMTGVEAMTLLDSLNMQPDEESLYQALLELRGFLEQYKDSDHDLYSIALSMFEILMHFERE
jgi:hypothetical protein